MSARERAVEHIATMLHGERCQWRCHWSAAPDGERAYCLATARGLLDGHGLVAVDPELVERVREADALVDQLAAPHRRGDGVLAFKRMEDAIPIDNAQAEANERRLALADAILEQLGGGR